MEIVDRYVYAVISKLSEERKEEIEEEIKALIYDLMEKYSYEPDEQKRAILVIEELGDPEDLANEYRGKERYLVGPKYFNRYIWVLKIVCFAIFIGISVGVAFQVLLSEQSPIAEIIANYIGTIFAALLQGAAWVTIIFVIMEKNNVSLKDEKWSIKDLPQLPAKKSKIPKSEAIAEIIFSAIFLGILYFSPQLIAIYFTENNEITSIPIFNVEIINSMSILIVATFTLIIFKGVLKLIWRNWTMKRAIVLSSLEVISAIVAIVVVSNNSLWNNDVILEFQKYSPISFSVIINGVITIIIIAAIIDVLISVYKGYKYGR